MKRVISGETECFCFCLDYLPFLIFFLFSALESGGNPSTFILRSDESSQRGNSRVKVETYYICIDTDTRMQASTFNLTLRSTFSFQMFYEDFSLSCLHLPK